MSELDATERLIRQRVEAERAALDKWLAEHPGATFADRALWQREYLIAKIDALRLAKKGKQ